MRYAVYAGTEEPWEVWSEREGLKHEKISGHPTSDAAHAARKRLKEDPAWNSADDPNNWFSPATGCGRP
jgi:hypothetical protein